MTPGYSCRSSVVLYRGGVAGSLEYLDAQRQLFSAEQAFVQAQVLRNTSGVDLYVALGGGLK
jgi:multidrug efflux system outer membrane protein